MHAYNPQMSVSRTKRRSLLARAILALLLMVGFYALSVLVVAVLGVAVYLDVHTGHVHPIVLLLAVIGIGSILYGIIPRPEPFIAPGPRVSPEEEPHLFQEIRRVAVATGSPMPDEVYIAAGPTASVAHVGRFAGIGRPRSVMVIGLPLLVALTVSEFGGVLAHEFGHFFGGETRLAPLIYGTRSAIAHTLATFEKRIHWSQEVISVPFVAYANLYLRTTQAISRRQEQDADLMAARVAGGDSMESALVNVHVASTAFDVYMNGEFVPLLATGYRPSLAEGFSRFLHAGGVAEDLQRTEEEMREQDSDPYDSHPSLSERLAALDDAPHLPAHHPDPAAIELLVAEDDLEIVLVSRITRGLDVRSLEPLAWDDVSNVWLRIWREHCQQEHAALEGITPAMFPDLARDPAEVARRMSDPDRAMGRVGVVPFLMGAALTVVLSQRGWRIDAGPGDPVTATLAGLTIQPFDVLDGVVADEASADAWLATCREAQIGDVDLGESGLEIGPEPEAASS